MARFLLVYGVQDSSQSRTSGQQHNLCCGGSATGLHPSIDRPTENKKYNEQQLTIQL